MSKIIVKEQEITILKIESQDYISLTDMIKAKDGDFFISDWLRNRNTIEYLGVWEKNHNSNFNYGEFAIITSKFNQIAIGQMRILTAENVRALESKK